MNRIRKTTLLAACLLAGAGVSARAAADSITLKTAARQRSGVATIVLSDIALLQGEEAQRLAQTPIATLTATSKPLEIAVAEVRRALDAAGANWARIDLSGGRVIVRPSREATGVPPAAMTAIALDGAVTNIRNEAGNDRETFSLDAVMAEATVRGMIANLIITSLQVEPCDMRVRFNADDDALLRSSTVATRFEVQPLGSLTGDRLAFAVRSWNEAAPESRGQITLSAHRRMEIARASHDLPRNSPVCETDIQRGEEWLTATEATQAAAPPETTSRTLTRALSKGDLMRRRDLSQAALVKRGDLVTVRCLVGGVALSLQAEARAEGGAGDIIEFRKSGERESFRATITAANEAVVNLGRK